MNTIIKQRLEDSSLVSDQGSKNFVMKAFDFRLLPIVNVGLDKKKIMDFSFVVHYNMQFEPEEPPYWTLALCS